MGRFKSKLKRQRVLNGRNMDESPVRFIKRRLVENVSAFKEVAGDQPHHSSS